ncbi:MAG: hypothetical protein FIA99_17735 [Ruminiclostridium sp.]|nr:hypothetical protein [Ruminiclostridium sp.]
MKKDLNIVLTCTTGWWNKYFYEEGKHREPCEASDDELERVYLERKRFLFEKFGEYGVGEEIPVRDNKITNVIMKWCVDFIPYILGVRLKCIEEGFWQAYPLAEDEIRSLKPVDIASTPFSEWMLRRKEILNKRYGSAVIGQNVEGSVNAAYRIRGEEFYFDLLMKKDLARHLLEVIAQTVIKVYEFFSREFDLKQVFLANCTNVHIGPAIYEEMGLPYDILVAGETKRLFSCEKFIYLHNCDSLTDKFVDLYKRVPYIYKIDGSHNSDIRKAKNSIPEAGFISIINPIIIQQSSAEELKDRIIKTLNGGADEIAVANIDPVTDINNIENLLKNITESCNEAGFNPVFDVVPITSDEYEWSFTKYQDNRVNHCSDDWRLLIPKAF